MLVQYKNSKYFNPVTIESISGYINGKVETIDNGPSHKLYIILHTRTCNIEIKTEKFISADFRRQLLNRDDKENYIYAALDEELEELVIFINKHCKGK
jgi:hypothetical protein